MSKVAIVGTGAMGSVYAGLLADAGNQVWAIDVWTEHVQAIERSGLRVTGASGDRTARLRASERAEDAGVCDLVVIATKAAEVAAAAASVRPLIGPSTLVLAIQNGLGSAERVTAVLGTEQVIIGIVGGFGAAIREPGHVHHEGWELLHIGELSGPATPRLRAVAELWASAGFTVQTYDDLDRMIWEKFICNVGFSGTAAVTGLTIGQILDDPNAWMIASGCATEAWQVARALGIAVAIDEPVSYLRAFGSKIGDARPSMLLDRMAGRLSEIDVINGAVPLQAARVGLSAPYNEVVSALVRQSEAGPGGADGVRAPRDVYTHGHHPSVLRSHGARTAQNSAAYLLPYLRAGVRVLDVGCGPGSITCDLAELVSPAVVVGIENVDTPLALARAHAAEAAITNVRFELGDVYALDYPDASFDVVHAHQVLQHLTDPIAALREMRRVCAPGGVVAARDADYAAMTWYPASAGLSRWQELYRAVAHGNGAEPDAGRRLLSWAQQAGFEQIAASASVWCYADESSCATWGSTWADRVTNSALSTQSLERGLATAEELQAIAAAWLDWSTQPDAWFTVLHGEILCPVG